MIHQCERWGGNPLCTFFMSLLLLISILLCQSFAASADQEPIWVSSLPLAHGRVYAIGVASLVSSEAKSFEIASQSARFEVLARLKSRIEGTISSQSNLAIQKSVDSPSSASSQHYVSVNNKTSVFVNDLPGLVIEERFIDKNSRTAYVLAYLDIKAAENGVRDRFKAIQADIESILKYSSVGVLSKIINLKKLQEQVMILENTSSLIIPFSEDKNIRSDAQKLRFFISSILLEHKRQLTVGFAQSSSLPSDLKHLFREAIIKEGFIWNDNNPVVILNVNIKGSNQSVDIHRRAWWEHNYRSNFIGVRVALSCSFEEPDGNIYGNFDLDARGVGTDEFSASRALMKELRKELPHRIHEAIGPALKI